MDLLLDENNFINTLILILIYNNNNKNCGYHFVQVYATHKEDKWFFPIL